MRTIRRMPHWNLEEVSQCDIFLCLCCQASLWHNVVSGGNGNLGRRMADGFRDRWYSVISISYVQFATSYIFAVRHAVFLLPMQ